MSGRMGVEMARRGCRCSLIELNDSTGRSEVGYHSAEVVGESCQEGPEEDVDVWYD